MSTAPTRTSPTRPTDRDYGLTLQERVQAFHKRLDQPCPDVPTMLTDKRGHLRWQLMDEELREYSLAVLHSDYLGMVDALVDLLYVTLGTAVEMGVDLAPFFEAVHAANMQKQPAPDGGKGVKPEGWTAPDLANVFQETYHATPPDCALADGGEDGADDDAATTA